jgi:hypothetical protein
MLLDREWIDRADLAERATHPAQLRLERGVVEGKQILHFLDRSR